MSPIKFIIKIIIYYPLMILTALIGLPLFLVVFVWRLIISTLIAIAVSILWVPRKTRYLIIYADSEHWKSYFEDEVIPSLLEHAKVINLSRDVETKKWWHLEWILYRHIDAPRIPLVIRFSPVGTWRIITFYNAFMQAEKGNNQALEKRKAKIKSWSYEIH
jgi:hypothetical protein